jgi:hypothetical protein
LRARAQTEPWCRLAGRFNTPLLSPEPAWRILYSPTITALNTFYRTITTNIPIPVITPLATPMLGDVAAPLYPAQQGQSIIHPVQ